MSDVIPFDFEGNAIRVVTQEDRPWFFRSDVSRVLGIVEGKQAANRLDDDERGVYTVPTPGGPQEVAIISESGFYSLVLTSRKPAAKRFKKWVTSEVLPSIRRTGGYTQPAHSIPIASSVASAMITHPSGHAPQGTPTTGRFATICIASSDEPGGCLLRTVLDVFEAVDENVAMGLAAIQMNRLWPRHRICMVNAIRVSD